MSPSPAIVPHRREPSGRKQRLTVAQKLSAAARKESLANMSVAMSQPHRRAAPDPESPMLESAFGRFCVAHRLDKPIYAAGMHYKGLVRRWRAAKGVPTQIRLGEGGGGPGPSDATVMEWERTIFGIERHLGVRARLRVSHLVIDDQPCEAGEEQRTIRGLVRMAVYLDYMDASGHPFREG